MRLSAPSLVRRAQHNNNHHTVNGTSSSITPSHDTTGGTTQQQNGDRHHLSCSHHGDGFQNHTSSAAAAASIATTRRSFFAFWKNIFLIKSKNKSCTAGRMFSCSRTSFHSWLLALCVAFLLLNLIISMGKIDTSPSFRRAHNSSSSRSRSRSSSAWFLTLFHSNHNENLLLRSHVQIPHSILLFSIHSHDNNSTSQYRPTISHASSSSRVVLPNHWGLPENKTADFGLLEIEMLHYSSKSNGKLRQRSIPNETSNDDDVVMATDDDMEDRMALFMTGWDDSSDAAPALGRHQYKKYINISNSTASIDNDVNQQQQQKDCQRVSWHRTIHPTCNAFHEFDIATVLLDETSAYIGGGSYRQVYLVETKPDPVIIKVMAIEDDSYIGIRSVGEFLMDGVIGAAVSNYPSLTEMYGFCSLSMFSEVVWGGSIEDQVVPRGRCSGTVGRMLNRTRTGPVESMNNLTATQKLEWAHMMTQSVAALHQHPEGSIIHSDIALRQFLITEQGKLKLTDFNQAQILRYDTRSNQSCPYISMHDYGSHRAPEVYMRKPATAQIDVWSLGACFYNLLTGLKTYYDECDEGRHAVPKKVIRGVQYTIDDRWRNHSFAERILVQAIEECSVYDPRKRITMESLLELLGNAVKQNRFRKAMARLSDAKVAKQAAIDKKQ